MLCSGNQTCSLIGIFFIRGLDDRSRVTGACHARFWEGLARNSPGLLDSVFLIFLIKVWLSIISRKIKHKYNPYQTIHISSPVAWLLSEALKQVLISEKIVKDPKTYGSSCSSNSLVRNV